MNSKTNVKINQVDEKTLVIGIDIAKSKHYACAIDERGRVLQKSFPFSQSNEGFNLLFQKIRLLLSEHQKTEILVGFEPTGHYSMNLASFIQLHGIPL